MVIASFNWWCTFSPRHYQAEWVFFVDSSFVEPPKHSHNIFSVFCSSFYTNLIFIYLELSGWVHSKTLNHHANNSVFLLFTFRASTCSIHLAFFSFVFFFRLVCACTFHTPTIPKSKRWLIIFQRPCLLTGNRWCDIRNHSHVRHDSAIIQLKYHFN